MGHDLGFIGVVDHSHKFIAAVASHKIHGWDGVSKDPCEIGDQRISGRVPQGVVDGF